ncbi:MAG: hypothetical protein H6955_22065 [Chromatiaceae bacterium]|nr:hypothetical protein [Gammaproteobacteria bacterium]MCP5316258.1 hypothetical protein [Chromatiaceae bacterium]
MVRVVLLLVALVAMTSVADAAALRIEGANAEVEMGKYLNLQIVYEGESAVGSADLQQWADDFFIDVRDSGTENLLSGSIRTTQQVRLYPRSTGEAVLERIALGGAVAGPLRVTVVPAVRNGIDGTPRWLPLPERVWQGQAFEIAVDAALMHPSNHIALDDAVLPGFDVQPLPRQTESRDGVEVVRLRWRVTAVEPGVHRLELPPIEQRGRGRWRFYLRATEIRVVPLPSYLPPSVPVGKVTLESVLVRGDGKQYWQVHIRNPGRLPDASYGLRAALATASGINPDRLGVAEVEADLETGIASQRYQVPLPDWSFGWGDGPTITLRYFDTDAGQLTETRTWLPPAWRMPIYAALVLIAVSVLLLVGAAALLVRATRRWLERRQFRQQLARAPDAHALRRLLITSTGHSILTDWAAQQRDPAATDVAELINKVCFSAAAPPDSTTLRQALRRARLL